MKSVTKRKFNVYEGKAKGIVLFVYNLLSKFVKLRSSVGKYLLTCKYFKIRTPLIHSLFDLYIIEDICPCKRAYQIQIDSENHAFHKF